MRRAAAVCVAVAAAACASQANSTDVQPVEGLSWPVPFGAAPDSMMIPYGHRASVSGRVLDPDGEGVEFATVSVDLRFVQRFDSIVLPGYRPCDGRLLESYLSISESDGSFGVMLLGHTINVLGCVLVTARPPDESGLETVSLPGGTIYLKHVPPGGTIDSLVVELVAPRR